MTIEVIRAEIRNIEQQIMAIDKSMPVGKDDLERLHGLFEQKWELERQVKGFQAA